jgi:superoxide dismutase, Fe-Mn family
MKGKVILFFCILLNVISLFARDKIFFQRNDEKNQNTYQKNYVAKDFSYLLGLTKFDDSLLKMHFKLYLGYVNNANYLLNELERLSENKKALTYEFGALKRRLGWEFDGMRLHELYFSNMGRKTTLDQNTPLYQSIKKYFGSYDQWVYDFKSTGKIRGIGWVVLYFDPAQGRLINVWVNEHDVGHLATGDIILVMDVWEHAYITQFGLDRGEYIDTFFNSIDWDVANKRYIQYRGLGQLPN